MIVLAAYGQELNNGVWRVSFGIGLILPVALLFFRLRMLDSEQYAKHAMKDQVPYLLVFKRYWKAIIGTSMAWFMYDFVVSLKSRSARECSVFFLLAMKLTRKCATGLPVRHLQLYHHLRIKPRGQLDGDCRFWHCHQLILSPGLRHRRPFDGQNRQAANHDSRVCLVVTPRLCYRRRSLSHHEDLAPLRHPLRDLQWAR
jgi:hypothetical protein